MLSLMLAFPLFMATVILWKRLVEMDPARWPNNPSLPKHISLVKRYLKSQGWQLTEAMPWMHIFVQGSRGGVWLNLMIHSNQSLSIPTLMKECIDKKTGAKLIVGILVSEMPQPELTEHGRTNGIFFIYPSQLPNVESYIAAAKNTLEARSGTQA